MAADANGSLPNPETADGLLIRLLRQLTVESARFAEMFGEAHGLHRTDLNALAVVMDATRRGRRMSPGSLAAALHLSPSATTSALDRLEASGHLRRTRDPADRRKIELDMTEKARRVGSGFFAPLAVEFGDRWREFTPEERATIVRFLTASIEATVTVRGDLAKE
ncbi:MarR family winged helix-turn-helix transcriptional regulator [Phytomonospora endophytica]|uniref:DNA-binding MarR family transcriptional regulator n=1 Tax=Phytomonospora endophytica TaxID=714109 RepID=A0A841G1H7_9ACTN|nr:MarR family transcriptional regulator [Phytomonospora endophytica]MBB6039612.1 DNA-binding MarR family transcriptional regulator [Phytomonospora endophytica]